MPETADEGIPGLLAYEEKAYKEAWDTNSDERKEFNQRRDWLLQELLEDKSLDPPK